MNNTIEHYQNRIKHLIANGETKNANLIKKARRNLSKLEAKRDEHL